MHQTKVLAKWAALFAVFLFQLQNVAARLQCEIQPGAVLDDFTHEDMITKPAEAKTEDDCQNMCMIFNKMLDSGGHGSKGSCTVVNWEKDVRGGGGHCSLLWCKPKESLDKIWSDITNSLDTGELYHYTKKNNLGEEWLHKARELWIDVNNHVTQPMDNVPDFFNREEHHDFDYDDYDDDDDENHHQDDYGGFYASYDNDHFEFVDDGYYAYDDHECTCDNIFSALINSIWNPECVCIVDGGKGTADDGTGAESDPSSTTAGTTAGTGAANDGADAESDPSGSGSSTASNTARTVGIVSGVVVFALMVALVWALQRKKGADNAPPAIAGVVTSSNFQINAAAMNAGRNVVNPIYTDTRDLVNTAVEEVEYEGDGIVDSEPNMSGATNGNFESIAAYTNPKNSAEPEYVTTAEQVGPSSEILYGTNGEGKGSAEPEYVTTAEQAGASGEILYGTNDGGVESPVYEQPDTILAAAPPPTGAPEYVTLSEQGAAAAQAVYATTTNND